MTWCVCVQVAQCEGCMFFISDGVLRRRHTCTAPEACTGVLQLHGLVLEEAIHERIVELGDGVFDGMTALTGL